MNGNPTNIGPHRRTRKRLPPQVANALRSDPGFALDDSNPLYGDYRRVQQTGEKVYLNRFFQELRRQAVNDARAANPFLCNLPDLRSMRRIQTRGGALLCCPANTLPMRLPLGKEGTSRNILVIGATGAGKSSFSRLLHLAYSGRAHQWIIDKKGDMAALANYEQPGEVIVFDSRRDVSLSLADGLDNLPLSAHIAETKRLLLANAPGLSASGRFLTTNLTEGYRKEGPAGLLLPRIIARIEALDTAATSRLGGYRATCLNVLTDLHERSGGLFDAPPSNLIERLLTSPPRTCVFNTRGLSSDIVTLYISLLYSYVYHRRLRLHESEPPIILSIDDAMEMAAGSASGERERRIHPIADFSMMGRSSGIGISASCQNFSLLSPSLVNNTATVISLASYGADAAAVSRFMDLTPEQSACIPRLTPGEAVVMARTQWPYAVYGKIPEVK